MTVSQIEHHIYYRKGHKQHPVLPPANTPRLCRCGCLQEVSVEAQARGATHLKGHKQRPVAPPLNGRMPATDPARRDPGAGNPPAVTTVTEVPAATAPAVTEIDSPPEETTEAGAIHAAAPAGAATAAPLPDGGGKEIATTATAAAKTVPAALPAAPPSGAAVLAILSALAESCTIEHLRLEWHASPSRWNLQLEGSDPGGADDEALRRLIDTESVPA